MFAFILSYVCLNVCLLFFHLSVYGLVFLFNFLVVFVCLSVCLFVCFLNYLLVFCLSRYTVFNVCVFSSLCLSSCLSVYRFV